ncbi:MAG: DnaB-like helicase C-terminal domain-containing protein [Prevotella sp.]|nr:DnaB-like helicase C-terminal domain-containing protein [Prevotella sp.]
MHSLTSCEGREVFTPKTIIKNTILHMNKSNENRQEELLRVGTCTKRSLERLIRRAALNTGTPGLHSGFYRLDEAVCGFQEGELITIAGRSNMGRLSLEMSIMRNMAVENKIPVLFYSLRYVKEASVDRLIALQAELPLRNLLNGDINDRQWSILNDKMDKLVQAPIIIEDSLHFEEGPICDMCKNAVEKHHLKAIFLDGIELVYHHHHFETSMVGRVKQLARELNVPIFITAYMNGVVGESNYEKMHPTIKELNDRESIDGYSDVLMIVNRPSVYKIYEDGYGRDLHNKAQIFITKNVRGPVGDFLLDFREDCGAFANEGMIDFSEMDNYEIPIEDNLSSLPL